MTAPLPKAEKQFLYVRQLAECELADFFYASHITVKKSALPYAKKGFRHFGRSLLTK